jgi:NAD(P)-dependent dehydrogenase (short-subunit alcohol dehydrogenase family)
MLQDQTMDAFPVDISAKRANAAPLELQTAPSHTRTGNNAGAIARSTGSQSRSMTAVLPIMGVVSVAFLVIGIALPVLPLHVHQDLGLSTFVVGLVMGSQIGGLVGGAKRGTYQASKHSVIGLTKSAALDYAARGIRINAVRLGLIHTPMADQTMAAGQADALNAMLKDVTIGRLGRAEEIAEAVLWLCSSAASLMVGHALAVDGGYTIR